MKLARSFLKRVKGVGKKRKPILNLSSKITFLRIIVPVNYLVKREAASWKTATIAKLFL